MALRNVTQQGEFEADTGQAPSGGGMGSAGGGGRAQQASQTAVARQRGGNKAYAQKNPKSWMAQTGNDFEAVDPTDLAPAPAPSAAVSAPEQPGVDPARNAFRQMQLQYIQELMAAARGEGNSYGQQALRNAYGQARNQIQSNIAGVRGVAAGAQRRMVAQQQAASDQNYNLDSRILKGQEQAAAGQALMNELGYLRDQDINWASAQQDLEARRRVLSDQMDQFYSGIDAKGRLTAHDLAVSRLRASQGFDAERQRQASERFDRYIQAAGTTMATIQRTDPGKKDTTTTTKSPTMGDFNTDESGSAWS